MGFVISKFNSSVFIRQGQNGPVNILLYIDDLVIVNANLEEINSVKSLLAASFDMKDLGDLHYFLGIEVIRTPEGIMVSQRHYVLNMLFKSSITKCKYVSTLVDRNLKLRPKSGMACDPKWFRQIVRSLIYMIITRSDISYPVGLIRQFMSQPASTCNQSSLLRPRSPLIFGSLNETARHTVWRGKI